MEGDSEGADGREGGSSLQSVISGSRQRAEAKSTQELQLELEAVRLKLLRRSQIIDVLRKAYVRDVVMVKNELLRKSTMTAEEYMAQGGPGTDITDAIPSLDLRPVLALFSPEDAFLRIESCASCGGHLEIVTKETKKVARLTRRISDMNETMAETAKEVAHLKAELTLTRHRVKELDERNTVNRDTLVAKLEQTQRACEAEVLALKEDSRRSERAWEAKVARKNEELAVIPVLREEGDMLRETLNEQRTCTEEDLRHKDSEIAVLKAEVAHLELSAEADAKVLLQTRNKADELQRRLKNEKVEHLATSELLKEEQGKYERCRSRLETSQEHLADLNERFNELRTEVEISGEKAEDEAGDASDALAATKMEITRLRTVLGTNNAAAALEAALLQISMLSEELHAARSEAREATNALKEDQEKLKEAQTELEKSRTLRTSKASMPSHDSRESSGGLSVTGSFLGSLDDELGGERHDRTSSTMAPGGKKFEQGKGAVEKWAALVRFRNAVNAHVAEVTRLHNLLRIAHDQEERSELTSQLELVSSRYSLDSMEDAMHVEVAALKLQAAGQSYGSAQTTRSAVDLDYPAWKETLDENVKAERILVDQKLADMEAHQKQAVEGLRLEVSKQREEIDRLESRDAEVKEKLKKLAKLEKNEKGHNAMTEELKKMEEETGLSCGLDSSTETIEGDLNREEESRLMEELDNAREEIKKMKKRQAMVTHELLGNIKGANAEIEMLKLALADMTAQRDARIDVRTLAGIDSSMSRGDAEEFKTLKEDFHLQQKKYASLRTELEETSHALLTLLEELRKSCKGTARAKAKVWNVRELDRARSIPPVPKSSIVLASGNSTADGGNEVPKVKQAANASGKNGGGAPRTSYVGIESVSSSARSASAVGVRKADRAVSGGSKGGSSKDKASSGQESDTHFEGADTVALGAACPDNEVQGRESVGGGGEERDHGRGETQNNGEIIEAELERRRQEREKQAETKKLQAVADQKELEDFQQACLLPQSQGVAFAVERLGAVQADVKEQFREVFLELKEALETHKKFVMRSRLEAKEVTGKMAALEVELNRLRQLHYLTEEELRARSSSLAQIQQDLNAEKSAGVATRKELAAAEKEARDNIFFKEKNAGLQKKLDQAEISSRRLKQECEKMKVEMLMAQLNEAENMVERMEEVQKSRVEGLTSTASQVNGHGDPNLGLGVQSSTQTEFHCPRLTLRRSNNQTTCYTRSLSAGSASGFGTGGYRRGVMGGTVCPAVDGRALAIERDLYSPGAGSAAYLEMQSSCTAHSPSCSTQHFDGHSDSLKQLSFRSPAWAGAATEDSLCDGAVIEGGAATIHGWAGSMFPSQEHLISDAGSGQAKNWGLWHGGGSLGPDVDVNVASEELSGVEIQRDYSIANGGGDGDQRTKAASESRHGADPHEPTVHYRPQTSPKVFSTGSECSISETIGMKGPGRPQRLHSRIFLQSARDLALTSPGGDSRGAGQKHQQLRQGVMSASKPARCARLNSTETQGKRPRTSSAVLSNGQDGSAPRGSTSRGCGGFSGDYQPASGWGEPGQCPEQGTVPERWTAATSAIGHQVIDLGVVHDAAPRPNVWNERQLAAAAAAATGRSKSADGGGWRVGVTKGGIVLDARFAKVREMLRRELVEAAERAKLPFLQQ